MISQTAASQQQLVSDTATRETTGYKIIIHGWYGIPNVGDEAILAAIVDDLRQLIPNAHITVFSRDPAHTVANHDVDDAIYVPVSLNREQKADVSRCLAEADLFILGGGGMFHSHSGRRPWLQTLAWAKLKGCKTALYTVGIDPSSLAKPHWKYIWQLFMKFADIITVRDEGSQRLLKQAGVKNDVIVIPDPVFRLRPAEQERARDILVESIGDISDAPLVSFGIGMPTYRFEKMSRFEYIRLMAKAADHIVETYQAKVLLVPYDFQPNRDVELSLEVIGLMKHRDRGYILLEEYTPREILAINSFVDFSVCTRFHSLIFAIKSNKPFVSIMYQQKVRELIAEAGLTDYGIGFNQLTVDSLIKKIDDAWLNRNDVSEILSSIALTFNSKASSASRLITELLTR